MDHDREHERLKQLAGRIDVLRAQDSAQNAKTSDNTRDAENISTGTRAGAELVTCIIAGGLIGWGLDSVFATKPVFLIIFMLLGVCTGFYEVYRITNNAGGAVGYRPSASPAPEHTEKS